MKPAIGGLFMNYKLSLTLFLLHEPHQLGRTEFFKVARKLGELRSTLIDSTRSWLSLFCQ